MSFSSSSASPTTTIQDLHADVLVAIFARLGLRDLCTVELVCKRWRDMAQLAWSTRSRFYVSQQPSLNDDHVLSKMIAAKDNGHALTHLELSYNHYCFSFGALFQHCPNIEHLNLSGIYPRESSLIKKTKGQCKLHTLVFRDCAYLGDAFLAQLLVYCTQLVHLDLSACHHVTGKCLEADGTATLRRLYIKNCNRVSSESLRQLFVRNSNFTHLQLYCLQLSKETIDSILSCKSLVDLQILIQLKHLSAILGECVDSGRRATRKLMDSLTKLILYNETGELINYYDEDTHAISNVLAHARRLNSLRLVNVLSNVDKDFTHQLIGAPLEELFFGALLATDVIIDAICQQLAYSLQLLTLRTNLRVSQQAIIKAIKELKHLRTLDLRSCKQVDNSILEAAVSILESDKSRRLFIMCGKTAVDCDQFMARYEGVRFDPENGNYFYKNLEWSKYVIRRI